VFLSIGTVSDISLAARLDTLTQTLQIGSHSEYCGAKALSEFSPAQTMFEHYLYLNSFASDANIPKTTHTA
jgi:hypothetical protein